MKYNLMLEGQRFNSVTHFMGALLAVIGSIYLITLAVNQKDMWKLLSFSIYGASLVLLYSASAAYHSHYGESKPLLRKIDHLSIYLLIAGSYMPFTLITLRDDGGIWVCLAVGALAITGIALEFSPRKGKRVLSIIIYLVMGWLILALAKPLAANLGKDGVQWLVAGGCFYTFGVLFYVFDKKVTHFHGVWHLFVLAGSVSHFIAVARFVA